MRVNNKVGITPRDRRLDRRKVATAAAIAAVLLFATQARAGLVNLKVRTDLSALTVEITAFDIADPATVIKVKDISAASNYGNPLLSNTNTSASGWIQMDLIPQVAITFQSGVSRINYGNEFTYFPFRDAFDNIASPPLGIPKGAQIGFEEFLSFDGGATFGEGFGFGNIYGLYQDFGTASTGAFDNGSTLGYFGAPLGSGPYIGADVALLALGGQFDLFGAFSADTSLDDAGPGGIPFPVVFAGNPVTYDQTFLTIPVTFSLNFIDDGIDWTIDTSGVIVAEKVPEPSSIIMLGIGVLGLVGCFVRARKRRV